MYWELYYWTVGLCMLIGCAALITDPGYWQEWLGIAIISTIPILNILVILLSLFILFSRLIEPDPESYPDEDKRKTP